MHSMISKKKIICSQKYPPSPPYLVEKGFEGPQEYFSNFHSFIPGLVICTIVPPTIMDNLSRISDQTRIS